MTRGRRPRRPRGIPWAAPTPTGCQVLLLASALTAGGVWAGLSLLRNLGLLLASLAAAGLLAGWMMALSARPRLRLTGPGDVRAGERAVWRLAVTTRLPRWVPLWVSWRVDGARFLIPVTAGGCAISYTPPRRGRLRAGVERLTCYDPLGLARARIPADGDGDILVLPRPLPPPPQAIAALPDAADTEAGASVARARGAGGRIQPGNLRDYRPGDSLGAVHWRQSARVDRLLVVDREHERRRARRLRLDVRANAYAAGSDTPESLPGAAAFETAVSRAAGVIEAWMREGHAVELRLGAERHRAAPAHGVMLLRRLAVVTTVAAAGADGATAPAAGAPTAPGDDRLEAGPPHKMPERDADVVITGVAADPPPQPAAGGHLLQVDRAPDPYSAPTPQPARTAVLRETSTGVAGGPARLPGAASQSAAAKRPPLRTARWQPLAAAVSVVALWHLATIALVPLLSPEPWAARSLAVAAATVLVPALVRTARPQRAGLACAAGLAAGTGALLWCWRGTGQASAWLADPVGQLRAGGAMLRHGIAPLTTGGVLGFALCLLTLLLAWVCALMSAGGADRCGLTGLVPAAAVPAPGIVLGRNPDDAVVLAAAAGVLALIITSAPSPAVGGARARGRAGSLAGVTAVTALAAALAAGAVSLAPALPARAWSWNVSGAGAATVSVPETTLALGKDLVRGSKATVFEYTTEGVPPGADLRFTLAVIRDLDGEVWEPLDEPGTTGVNSLAEPAGVGALTASGAVVAAGLTESDVRIGAADLQQIHIRIRNLSSTRLPVAQSTVMIRRDRAPSGGTGLDLRSWVWVPGTSTAVSRDGATELGAHYTALGWNAVAGADGAPQVFPPYAAVAAEPAALAAYTDTPPGSDMIAATAREVVEAAGLGGSDAAPAAQAAALTAWFHTGGFAYDESAPGGFDTADVPPVETIASFLDERRGYCVHYAAAFTLMARSLGLPTRIAIGYASRAGEATTSVSGRDLHAWPEVWFDGVGWVAFEPTPGGAGARADTGTTVPSEPTAEGTTTAASASARATPTTVRPTASGKAAQASTVRVTVLGAWLGRHRLWPLGAVCVALLLAAPALVRVGRRRRRLRRIRDGDRPAAAAWEELADTAADLGLWNAAGRGDRGGGGAGEAARRAGPRARTHEALAEYLAAAPGLSADVRRALEEVAEAAVAEAYAGGTGGTPDAAERGNGTGEDAEGGADDGTADERRRLTRRLRTATTGLARTTPSVLRLRARLLPASLWRRR
ncbi:transglutaminaseTgpA domain-containing protein [Actinomyces ruminicola]|uniref:transglutaminaseTgpA domain-containing protein n=1 Tax=Actinomyces ruminicola TaxID=332524 RepID=UPI0015A39360|nr:transglutaminaseTgpA domain-containing protein [Actinomyces ruminicola]